MQYLRAYFKVISLPKIITKMDLNIIFHNGKYLCCSCGKTGKINHFNNNKPFACMHCMHRRIYTNKNAKNQNYIAIPFIYHLWDFFTFSLFHFFSFSLFLFLTFSPFLFFTFSLFLFFTFSLFLLFTF